MRYGQMLMPPATFPGWHPSSSAGTQSFVSTQTGYRPPAVLQPQGNYDAWDVIYDAPRDPFFSRPQPTPANYPVRGPVCLGQRAPDAQLPDGTQVWEKTFPGSPIYTGSNGEWISATPQLPFSERGTIINGGEVLGDAELTASDAGDEFMRGALGTLGAVAVIGLLAYFGLKGRGV